MSDYKLTAADINHWAIHPGGRAILDKVEQSFALRDEQIASPRNVLANYGNMSSATILFVLADLLQRRPSSDPERVLAMAFGPGLTIESGLLTKLPNA
ncbi:MAG: 3-oxoacyl-[acyl-carrier-protein] synthase III C-terminal domain-containing protein [Fodinibius sp.]|nr:3-oxoacyl-[acyl-carrier-protein] synthase III C-terminal domain-containing protein [Fodinibius sp.]